MSRGFGSYSLERVDKAAAAAARSLASFERIIQTLLARGHSLTSSPARFSDDDISIIGGSSFLLVLRPWRNRSLTTR